MKSPKSTAVSALFVLCAIPALQAFAFAAASVERAANRDEAVPGIGGAAVPGAVGTSTRSDATFSTEPTFAVLPQRLAAATSVAPAVTFSEGFEGVFPGSNWTLLGSPTWDDEQYRPRSGSWAGWCAGSAQTPPATYPDLMNAWMIRGPFSLSGATSASFDFWLWNDSELNFDYFRYMASVDGTNFSGFQTSGNTAGYQSRSLDLANVPTFGSLLGQDQVWVAFQFTSDETIGASGASVDDVSINVNQTVDLTADDIVLRTAESNGGSIVTDPQPGQVLYPTFYWHYDGGTTQTVPVRIRLDGVTLCSGSHTGITNGSWYTYCLTPWTVTAGNHTLDGTVDHTAAISESNEANNSTSRNYGVESNPEIHIEPLTLNLPVQQGSAGAETAKDSAAAWLGEQDSDSLRGRVVHAMLETWVHGVTMELALEEVGEDGVPILLELLEDSTFPRRDNLVAFLSYLGGEGATAAMVAMLESPPGDPELPEEDRALLLAPHALGHMASRGRREALQALLRMTAHHSNGEVLGRTAAFAKDPQAMRDDLIERAVYGLALADDPAAVRRLDDIASGRTRPSASGRDLTRDARSAIELRLRMSGNAAPSPSTSASIGVVSPAEDAQPRKHQAGLDYANHPNTPSPMSNSRLDQILADATGLMQDENFASDVGCCVALVRSGNALTFGLSGDGRDSIDNSVEESLVLNDPAARVKTVRLISWCGGSGTNIIGCGYIGGDGIALVRRTDATEEGILWAHEFGHNVGLDHQQGSSQYVMSPIINVGGGLTQGQCDLFHFPVFGAGITPVDIGDCDPNGSDFTISNDGDSQLSISSIALDQSASWITWSPQAPFNVAAGASVDVTVTVDIDAAPGGETSRRLLVSSNDSDESPYPNGVFVVTTKAQSCPDEPNPCTDEVVNGDVCTHVPNSAACNDGAYCNGSDTCNAGSCSQHAGSPCAGGGECADSCNESTDSCNDSAGTSCSSDSNPCTIDQCNGSGSCSHQPGNAGTTCRAGASVCDSAETCNGSSALCPANTFASTTVICRSAASICDTPESCSGTGSACPANAMQPSATVCRPANGVCDTQELCTGSTADCPADAVLGSATLCRASAGICDAAEQCTGSSKTCPSDAMAASSTPCRATSGACDQQETCSGSAPSCPGDALSSSQVVCRSAAGNCDAPELCSGSSPVCPGNTFSSSLTVCRESSGVCDAAELCTGSGAACPGNAFSSSLTVCRGSAGACDAPELCSGTTASCPGDAFSSSLTVCRSSAGVCDLPELCSGSGQACPADSTSASTTVCRESGGDCDLAELCSGSSAACPGDALKPDQSTCSSDGNVCTDDLCSGVSKTCQHLVNTAPCNDAAFCNGADTCSIASCGVHAGDPCSGPDGDANCSESCSEAGDHCSAPDPDGSPCNDGDDCTLSDQCSAGVCSGAPDPGCTTTTTTLLTVICGDVSGDQRITSSDALLALRAAVSSALCEPWLCDYNGDGDVTAGDALAILRVAVGHNVAPMCPEAASAPEPAEATSTSTTTLP